MQAADNRSSEIDEAVNFGLTQAAIDWLRTGERDSSTDTMFSVITGFELRHMTSYTYPTKLDSLARCRKLLERECDLAERIHLMGQVCPEWERIVAIWKDLCAAMDDEAPDWRHGKGQAPRTLALLASCYSD